MNAAIGGGIAASVASNPNPGWSTVLIMLLILVGAIVLTQVYRRITACFNQLEKERQRKLWKIPTELIILNNSLKNISK